MLSELFVKHILSDNDYKLEGSNAHKCIGRILTTSNPTCCLESESG